MKKSEDVEDVPEKDLIALAKSGDKKAMCKLLKMHEGFLCLVVAKYHVNGFEHSDLLQIARGGVIKAIETYNPELNYKFLTHAIWRIKGDIKSITKNTIKRNHISLDAPRLGDSKHNIIDAIQDDYDYDIHHDYSKLIAKCAESLRTEKQKKLFAILLNNYLNDELNANLKSAGEILNVTRESARQIRNSFINNKAFVELREELVK